MGGIDDLLNENENNKKTTKVKTHKKSKSEESTGSVAKMSAKDRNQDIRLSDVKFNYRNRRVVTQLVRFIPDELVNRANETDSPQQYILDHVDEISVNNVVLEFRQSSDSDDILNYPRYDSLYDTENEGIFVGRDIVFSNINSSNPGHQALIDEFVENVTVHGTSIKMNGGILNDNPKAVRVGGQRYQLIYGHQRLCYAVFSNGYSSFHEFIIVNNDIDQDREIFIENNSKEEEKGYEYLVSLSIMFKKLQGTEESKMQSLGLKRTKYYKIRPLITDLEMIDLIRDNAITIPENAAGLLLQEAKKAVAAVGDNSRDGLINAYTFKLQSWAKANIAGANLDNSNGLVQADELSHEAGTDTSNNTAKTEQATLKLPTQPVTIENLLFKDVRTWSELDFQQYDLSNKKDLKKLFNDLIEEASDLEE